MNLDMQEMSFYTRELAISFLMWLHVSYWICLHCVSHLWILTEIVYLKPWDAFNEPQEVGLRVNLGVKIKNKI